MCNDISSSWGATDTALRSEEAREFKIENWPLIGPVTPVAYICVDVSGNYCSYPLEFQSTHVRVHGLSSTVFIQVIHAWFRWPIIIAGRPREGGLGGGEHGTFYG